MRRRLLFFTIAVLVYMLHANTWAQESGQPEEVSMEGTLLMLDNMTPHNAVPVQVIREGKAVATTLSDERGKYRFINLKPGEYQVRCQVLGGYVYYRATDSALRVTDYESQAVRSSMGKDIGDRLRIKAGSVLTNVDFRFAAFKKGVWKNYTALDGLAQDIVLAISQDREGALWFGTYLGVSRYDGKEFRTFTKEDGLAHDSVRAIHSDSSGSIWFGTHGGVSRYDGRKFDKPLTTEDGLPSNVIGAIHSDLDGALWFGTGWWTAAAVGRGVSRYDGRKFENFSTEDGLRHNTVWAIHSEPRVIWLGTHNGVSQYKDGKFVNLEVHYKGETTPGWVIRAIHRSPDGTVWFGEHSRGVYQYNGRELTVFDAEGGLINTGVWAICSEPDGTVWFGCGNGLSRYDGKCFVNFTRQDGFIDRGVNTIYCDSNGILWVGTDGGGVFQYDREALTNLTTRDGLANNYVYATYRDPEGALWFACRDSVSRYDGKEFLGFTQKDGLRGSIYTVNRTPDGMMWFGSGELNGSGIFQYDGRDFANLTARDGLAHGIVLSSFAMPDGAIWFGTETGLSYYDGREFTNFTERDGLTDGPITDIDGASDGTLWLGTGEGLFRYNGESFGRFTTGYEYAGHWITAVHCAGDNVLWFSTMGRIIRYDGQKFAAITPHLRSSILVLDIYSDSHDTMWFGTQGRGAIAYDGTAWTSLDTRDGLPGNIVESVAEDSDGSLWFGTDGGAAHYRRSEARPGIRITSVSTEQDTYRDLAAIPAIATGTYVTINYSASDLKTVPEKRQYRYQLKELDRSWREPIRDAAFTNAFREPGTYTFMVQAIDRDLNYSKPASLALEFVSPFYIRAVFLVPVTGIGVILLLTSIISLTAYTKRRRQIHAYQQAAVRELQDAQEMQMSLLPEAAPVAEGMEIAGRSIPANTVGGDFFDYLALADGKVGMAIADVSGKGLRAAMNAVLASGMLYEVVKTEVSCGSILSVMNAGLYPRTEKQMFTAFSFAIIDQDTGAIQWSNAAQPHPLIKRSNAASEAEEDGQLPLGMAPDVKYPDCELKLEPDNIIIFYTDGIIEAENEAEEMYGSERLLKLVNGIDPSASAEHVIQAILQDVSDFVGAAQQYDDMTIVAVRKL